MSWFQPNENRRDGGETDREIGKEVSNDARAATSR